MRAILLLIVAALPLAACDIQKTDGNENVVTFNASDKGAVAFQVPGVKGNIKLPGAMTANSDMDIDGVKLFPGSRVTNVRAEDGIVTIGFASPKSVADVKDHYARQFAAKDVTATLNGDKFSGSTKDGDAFTLDLAEADGKTAGTMVIRDRK